MSRFVLFRRGSLTADSCRCFELEYDKITTAKAAQVVAATVGGTARYEGTHLSNWAVTMPDGRKWNCETDASVSGGSETVSPILKLADIPMLQEVVRALRKAGAKKGVISPTAQPCRVAVGYKGCAGLHIHVGAQGMSPKQIQNLVKIFYKQEELIVKALGVTASRLGWYTRRTNREFVELMLRQRNPTMESLANAYYHGVGDRHSHYSSARYRTLNLHNLWNGTKGTLEFRLFQSTLHSGELRSNVMLALSIVHKAKIAKI